MKSGFWQNQIAEKHRYKTAFTIPFGHYKWNVMPFGLKNAASEFQHITNDMLNDYSIFSVVYLDDVIIFSKNLDQRFKHLKIFFNVFKRNRLANSAPKMKLLQTKMRFLAHDIFYGY